MKRIRASLKRRLIPISSVSVLLLFAISCRTAPPKVDLTLWAGDSSIEGVKRAQSNEAISCSDPAIDGLVCMSYADLKKLFDVIWSCQRWPAGIEKMKREEIEAALELYSLVSRKAQGAKE